MILTLPSSCFNDLEVFAKRCVAQVDGTATPLDQQQHLSKIVEKELLKGELEDGVKQLTSALNAAKQRSEPGVLIRNMPIGNIPDTPTSKSTEHKEIGVSEVMLCLVALSLGQIATYPHEHGGDLFHNVHPIRKDEMLQTNASSGIMLDAHVELAFREDRPRFIALLGLRQDRKKMAETLWLPAVALANAVSSSVLEELQKPKFYTTADESWLQRGYLQESTPRLVSVLHPLDEQKTSWAVLYDRDLMHAVDEPAKQALNVLSSVVISKMLPHKMVPGDLLVINNRVAIHARTSFPAFYDGSDRWLQRVNII